VVDATPGFKPGVLVLAGDFFVSSKRILQVSEQIREHIAMMLIRGELSDPRLKNITINSVRVSPDLQLAKVYYSVMGTEAEQNAVDKGLKQASGFIRRSIGEALKMRYTPSIAFFYDESIVRAARISELIETIKREDAKADGEVSLEQSEIDSGQSK
jgi:ribosome-binding factor A